jgi:hypothetical protein
MSGVELFQAKQEEINAIKKSIEATEKLLEILISIDDNEWKKAHIRLMKQKHSLSIALGEKPKPLVVKKK